MTQDGTIMGSTFEWSTANFGAEMVACTTLCTTVMTTTAFHGRADPFAKELAFSAFETS
jgi:hypothetical protein